MKKTNSIHLYRRSIPIAFAICTAALCAAAGGLYMIDTDGNADPASANDPDAQFYTVGGVKYVLMMTITEFYPNQFTTICRIEDNILVSPAKNQEVTWPMGGSGDPEYDDAIMSTALDAANAKFETAALEYYTYHGGDLDQSLWVEGTYQAVLPAGPVPVASSSVAQYNFDSWDEGEQPGTGTLAAGSLSAAVSFPQGAQYSDLITWTNGNIRMLGWSWNIDATEGEDDGGGEEGN